jgi:hypothetical protein
MELRSLGWASMKPEQISMLRQVAGGQARPDGEERLVSRICGGLARRKYMVRTGSCSSRTDPTGRVAEYEITAAGLAYLETLDAGTPVDITGPNRDRARVGAPPPAYIGPTLERIAAGTANYDDVVNIVRRADELGLEAVRLMASRSAAVKPERGGGTIKLLGRDGPRSSEDVTPKRVDDLLWAAEWRVADLKLWLAAYGGGIPPRVAARANLAVSAGK